MAAGYEIASAGRRVLNRFACGLRGTGVRSTPRLVPDFNEANSSADEKAAKRPPFYWEEFGTVLFRALYRLKFLRGITENLARFTIRV
jgi:hypothetical protein